MDMTITEVTLMISVANLLVVAIGVWFVWMQIKKTHIWNRRRLTMNETNKWDDPMFRQKRLVLQSVADPFDNEVPSFNEVRSDLSNEHLDTLRMVLNYFDSLGAGIRFGQLDDKMCYESISINIRRYFDWATPYILEMRQIEPRAWEEIDHMLARWCELDKERMESSIPAGYNPL